MSSNRTPRVMDKQALVWRAIADKALVSPEEPLHQQALAAELSVSKGHVHHAIAPLRAMGALDVVGKVLVVRDVRKVLMYWAVHRLPQRDELIRLRTGAAPLETAALCPPGLIFTSFVGFVHRYGEQPAPLPFVRAYVDPADGETREELTRRFAAATGEQVDLVIHAADAMLARERPATTSPAQIYVDLWNEPDFFAVDYLRAMDRTYHLA